MEISYKWYPVTKAFHKMKHSRRFDFKGHCHNILEPPQKVKKAFIGVSPQVMV